MIVHSNREAHTMKIGIITAMAEEFSAVADSLGVATTAQVGTFRGGSFSMAGHDFLLIESGMGFANAAMAAEMLIIHDRPDLLISTGFCGGIAPELIIGDVVVAKKIIIANESGLEEIPVQLCSIARAFFECQEAVEKNTIEGTFVTTSTVTSKARLACLLSGQHPNPVVEMESGAIAIIAAEYGVPLLAIRAVSDPADEELRFSLDELCDPDMRRILPYKVLLTALRKPYIIAQLVRLSRSSSRAAESLTAALSRLFPAL